MTSINFQARRLITLHRNRRNTISNEKFRESCYELNRKHSIRKNSYHDSLYNYPKNFDEDGYLSPMEIQKKVRNHVYRYVSISIMIFPYSSSAG